MTMKTYKIYKSELILQHEELKVEGVNLRDTKSVLHFAENTLKISTFPEEVSFVICMNPSKKCVDFFELSRGTLLETQIGMKELMKRVLITNAHSFLIVHNHPMGDAIPSDEDYRVTEHVSDASKLLDIEFLDHIIIGQHNYLSMRELAKKEEREW